MENKYFQAIISFISNATVLFELPSRKSLKNLSRVHAKREREMIKKELESATDIAITTDAWTSTKQHLGFIGITVHYFANFVLKSVSIGVKCVYGHHDGRTLGEAIKAHCENFGIWSKVKAITGDNAGNMRLAASYLTIPFYPCFAHILNRIIVTVLGNLKIDLKDDEDLSHSTVDSILHKLRRLVGLFNKSTILNEELLKAQQPINSTPKKGIKVKLLRLIKDVKTRLV